MYSDSRTHTSAVICAAGSLNFGVSADVFRLLSFNSVIYRELNIHYLLTVAASLLADTSQTRFGGQNISGSLLFTATLGLGHQ